MGASRPVWFATLLRDKENAAPKPLRPLPLPLSRILSDHRAVFCANPRHSGGVLLSDPLLVLAALWSCFDRRNSAAALLPPALIHIRAHGWKTGQGSVRCATGSSTLQSRTGKHNLLRMAEARDVPNSL